MLENIPFDSNTCVQLHGVLDYQDLDYHNPHNNGIPPIVILPQPSHPNIQGLPVLFDK